MTLPFRPTSCAVSEMPPDAIPTDGSARTWVRSEAGSEGVVGALPLLLDEIALLPVITASVFW